MPIIKNKPLLLQKITRIVFWEPCTSPHKVDFFAAIAAIAPNIEVVCCANNELPKERREQGWSIKCNDAFETIVGPTLIEINKLVEIKKNNTLHIFSGIRWAPNIVAGLKSVKRNNAKFAIMSEPRVGEGWRGAIRYLQSWLTEGWLRRHSNFILAQGKNGPPWFRSVGYPIDRIFSFAYFINPAKILTPYNNKNYIENSPIQIGYAGRLVKMKGIFDLVIAIKELGATAQLNVAGSGPEENDLKIACQQLQLDTKFFGVVPIQEMSDFMRKLDILVLASTSKDGWGVVISEALMCGTAVIATPFVGASLLLNDPLFGRCVPPGSPESIVDAVQEMKMALSYTAKIREKREILAKSRLSAESGARHLLDIIEWCFSDGPRPIPFYESKDHL